MRVEPLTDAEQSLLSVHIIEHLMFTIRKSLEDFIRTAEIPEKALISTIGHQLIFGTLLDQHRHVDLRGELLSYLRRLKQLQAKAGANERLAVNQYVAGISLLDGGDGRHG